MKNADYWRGRFAILEEAAQREADQCISTLEDMFREAERTVQADIERWYGRFATNNKISLTEARKWLTTGQLEEFKWTVDQYIKIGQQANLSPEWIKKLENASARFHISRLEAVQMQIQQQLELLYGNQLDSIDDLLKDVVSNGYTKTAFEIQKGMGIGWDITALNQKKIETLLSRPWTADKKTFRDRCWEGKANLVTGIQKNLTQGLLRGDSPQKITDAVKKQFNVSRYQAGRLVHTETTYFNAAASYESYKELGVDMVEIIETLDSHTCEICQPLDGTVIPLSQYEPGVTVPPFHPNCRGTTAPAIDETIIGERAARNADGKVYYVPSNMKYGDWVKTFTEGGSKDWLTVATVGAVIQKIRDYTGEFGTKFGKDHYDAIRDRVDGCSNPTLQKVWDAYENQIKVANPHHNGGAYCSGNNIYVGINGDAKARKYFAPYSTTFHESGHALDSLTARLGTPNGQWHFSSTYKDSLFPKTIKEEVDDWAKSILADMKAHKTDFQYWVNKGWITKEYAEYYAANPPKILKSMAFQAIKREITALEPLQMCDISDILEGATRGKIVCGIGHGGGSYWTNRAYNGVDWGLGTEAFAEMVSASMACPESLATIKKYLPKSYALFEEMLEVIANQI